MNKKPNFLLFWLLLTGGTSLYSTVGVEMTFPPSALLWLCEDYPEIQQNMKENDKYYRGGTNTINSRAMPQVDGYYATTSDFYIMLQRGGNGYYCLLQQPNASNGVGPFANPIVYFSDIVRAWRSPAGKTGRQGAGIGNSDNANFSCQNGAQCPQGPSSGKARGNGNNPSAWPTFDDIVARQMTIPSGYWNTLGLMQLFNFSNLTGSGVTGGTNGLQITESKFLAINGQTSYYFGGTGVDIYLPLHMIAPGDNLTAADPDYVNYGPTPPGEVVQPTYSGSPYGEWKSWSYSYCPPDIPAQKGLSDF